MTIPGQHFEIHFINIQAELGKHSKTRMYEVMSSIKFYHFSWQANFDKLFMVHCAICAWNAAKNIHTHLVGIFFAVVRSFVFTGLYNVFTLLLQGYLIGKMPIHNYIIAPVLVTAQKENQPVLSQNKTQETVNHGHNSWDVSTHLPLDKMAVISQTIFSDAFSSMSSFVFWLKFHWSLFLRVQLTIT